MGHAGSLNPIREKQKGPAGLGQGLLFCSPNEALRELVLGFSLRGLKLSEGRKPSDIQWFQRGGWGPLQLGTD